MRARMLGILVGDLSDSTSFVKKIHDPAIDLGADVGMHVTRSARTVVMHFRMFGRS